MKPAKRLGRYYVYILECSDRTYYTGYAKNLEKRIREHNAGKRGAKYTRSKRPVGLVWCKEYRYFKSAVKKEIELKKLTRKAKEKLVRKYAQTR